MGFEWPEVSPNLRVGVDALAVPGLLYLAIQRAMAFLADPISYCIEQSGDQYIRMRIN